MVTSDGLGYGLGWDFAAPKTVHRHSKRKGRAVVSFFEITLGHLSRRSAIKAGLLVYDNTE